MKKLAYCLLKPSEMTTGSFLAAEECKKESEK